MGLIGRLVVGALLAGVTVAQAACPARPIVLAHFEAGHAYHAGTGIEVDIRDEMSRRSGCSFKADVYPRARIWAELEAGRIDMALTAIESEERLRYAWFVPYLGQKNMVLLLPSVPANVHSRAELLRLPTLRFGAVRGYRHGEPYDDFIGALAREGRLDTVVDSPKLFEMLRAGRVQAMLSVPFVYRYELEQHPIPGLRVEDWAPEAKMARSGLMLSRATFSEDDARYWQQVFDAMKDDGTLLRILQRYLPANEARAALIR